MHRGYLRLPHMVQCGSPTLDLKSAYWQVELEEDAKPLTAFTMGPLGFWECECMPFGLTNAPATLSKVDGIMPW